MKPRILLLSCGAVAALGAVFACGGISDPTQGSGDGVHVATVSGSLTAAAGTVPANAHVAVVWRAGQNGPLAIGADVPVVDGKFTMSLAAPPSGYSFAYDGADESAPVSGFGDGSSSSGSTGSGSGSGSTTPAPVGTLSLHPKDTVSGTIAGPLMVAVAGFVVYADANGNGALDVSGDTAASPDTLLGGASDLYLTYFSGGGSLDYEKLRDKAGVAPTAGFDLAWEQGRWLPLTDVELTISSNARLPDAVCETGGVDYASGSSDVGTGSSGTGGGVITPDPSGGSSGSSGSVGTDGYPSPDDPNLHCAADGRSFTYDSPSTCPPPPPAPVPGLCSYDTAVAEPCASGGYASSLVPGETTPEGWPCTVAGDSDGGTPLVDAGSAPDSGT